MSSVSPFLDPRTAAYGPTTRLRPGQRSDPVHQPARRQSAGRVPNNSDYYFSEIERERINGQPSCSSVRTDSFTLTADALYAQNENRKCVPSQGNWFNRPFAQVTSTGASDVSVTYLQESLSSPKDIAWGQQLRATKDKLQSFGLNLRLGHHRQLRAGVRRATSEAKS